MRRQSTKLATGLGTVVTTAIMTTKMARKAERRCGVGYGVMCHLCSMRLYVCRDVRADWWLAANSKAPSAASTYRYEAGGRWLLMAGGCWWLAGTCCWLFASCLHFALCCKVTATCFPKGVLLVALRFLGTASVLLMCSCWLLADGWWSVAACLLLCWCHVRPCQSLQNAGARFCNTMPCSLLKSDFLQT